MKCQVVKMAYKDKYKHKLSPWSVKLSNGLSKQVQTQTFSIKMDEALH
jgi:hypothetical protein